MLKENRLGSINKEELLKNKLPKRDLRGAATKLFRVISLTTREESLLALSTLSLRRPYLAKYNLFK